MDPMVTSLSSTP